MTMLLIEDNEDDIFAVKWALKKAGIDLPLQVVNDGRRAIEYLGGEGEFEDRERFPVPDLVFLDLKLPYYNGHEILEWLRRRPELESVSVVILSGSDEVRDHDLVEGLCASDYLVKPPTPEDLGRLIDAAIKRTAASRQSSID